MTVDHWWELHLQRWQLRQKRNVGKNGVPFFFGGCLQKGMEMLVFVVWRGACWLVFWKLLSFFLAWCVFFLVGLFCGAFWGINQIFLHSERKNEKDCQTDPGELLFFLGWFWFLMVWILYSIRWTEMGFKRIPSPPGKGRIIKKSPLETSDLFRSSQNLSSFPDGVNFLVSQGRGGVLGV